MSVRRQAAALLAVTTLASILVPVASGGPVVVAGAPTATALVSDGWVIAPPTDQYSGSGSAASIGTHWTPAGSSAYDIGVTGPTATGLAVGSWDFSSSVPSSGGLVKGSTLCSSGHVDVLQAPVIDGGGALTAFAADWSGCGTGSIRVGSSVPVAVIRAEPDFYNFGSVSLGTSASYPIVLRNVGNQALAISGYPMTAGPGWAGAEDFSVGPTTCGGTLAAGATCTATVTFAPTVSGSRQGVLQPTATPTLLGGQTTLSGYGMFAPAANDKVSSPAEVSALPYHYWADATTATSSRLDPVCDGGYRRSVWFHYAAGTSGPVQLSTAGSWASDWNTTVDTVIGVYEGTPPEGLTELVCGDDVSASDGTSLVRFPAVAGHDYWIMVAEGQEGTLGDLTFTAVVGAPDTSVAVSGWAAQYGTFYPYVDGYRDSVATGVTLAEPANVSVGVASAASPSKMLRHAVLGRLETGYGWAWNGRSDAGATLAAGSYVITHTITDVFGNTVTHAFPVTLSAKRIYWTTTTRVINGSSFFARDWNASKGTATASGTSFILKSGKGWAYVVYRLKVVSSVGYKTVRFEVVGKSTNGRKAVASVWDTRDAQWTYATSIGPAYGTWKTPSVAASTHLNGPYAYGMVRVTYSGGAVSWKIDKARLTYTYAVLK